ncbi:predicted protein [Postia placenta Mad-698-R]|uniref:C2H2-type domain-containing protein n=1 Tax=Postia placenta MAD-698-R-SB12 TaxID=670580 RepID=A0A1X6NBG2_9APHY|nr:hypothetical protein POSPLADRAFT_1133130 [Postia placenta MAD-698-R-SB12]EED79923.1 predicted protein [Postia placenta Mad-698-R]OSX65842.1 hypothetical protein POSPLADRAFT_1133130 [Postia placenta MAD-698-R-SB12]
MSVPPHYTSEIDYFLSLLEDDDSAAYPETSGHDLNQDGNDVHDGGANFASPGDVFGEGHRDPFSPPSPATLYRPPFDTLGFNDGLPGIGAFNLRPALQVPFTAVDTSIFQDTTGFQNGPPSSSIPSANFEFLTTTLIAPQNTDVRQCPLDYADTYAGPGQWPDMMATDPALASGVWTSPPLAAHGSSSPEAQVYNTSAPARRKAKTSPRKTKTQLAHKDIYLKTPPEYRFKCLFYRCSSDFGEAKVRANHMGKHFGLFWTCPRLACSISFCRKDNAWAHFKRFPECMKHVPRDDAGRVMYEAFQSRENEPWLDLDDLFKTEYPENADQSVTACRIRERWDQLPMLLEPSCFHDV